MLFAKVLLCAVGTVSALSISESQTKRAELDDPEYLFNLDGNLTQAAKAVNKFDGTQSGALMLVNPIQDVTDAARDLADKVSSEPKPGLCGIDNIFSDDLSNKTEPAAKKLSAALLSARKKFPPALLNTFYQLLSDLEKQVARALKELVDHACSQNQAAYKVPAKKINAEIDKAVQAYKPAIDSSKLMKRDAGTDYDDLNTIGQEIVNLTKQFKKFDGTQSQALMFVNPIQKLGNDINHFADEVKNETSSVFCYSVVVFVNYLKNPLEPDTKAFSKAVIAARKKWPPGLVNVTYQLLSPVSTGFHKAINQLVLHACTESDKASIKQTGKKITDEIDAAVNSFKS